MDTATIPVNNAKALQCITFFKINNSGKEMAAILIINASVVPTATPLSNIASTKGITPTSSE
jgi:hypothetical protein